MGKKDYSYHQTHLIHATACRYYCQDLPWTDRDYSLPSIPQLSSSWQGECLSVQMAEARRGWRILGVGGISFKVYKRYQFPLLITMFTHWSRQFIFSLFSTFNYHVTALPALLARHILHIFHTFYSFHNSYSTAYYLYQNTLLQLKFIAKKTICFTVRSSSLNPINFHLQFWTHWATRLSTSPNSFNLCYGTSTSTSRSPLGLWRLPSPNVPQLSSSQQGERLNTGTVEVRE